jgi:hypothetical protein
VHGSEDADMSNEKAREIRARRKPKVSWATFFVPGLVGPKEKRTANSMDIRLTFLNRRHLNRGDASKKSLEKPLRILRRPYRNRHRWASRVD